MLEDRVAALRLANIYERQSYRHLMGIPFVLGQEGEATLAHTPFMVARIMSTGQTDMFATGYFKDKFIQAENTAQSPATHGVLLAERVVVCDSTVTDTLLAIPL